jgi:hypothetical protein
MKWQQNIVLTEVVDEFGMPPLLPVSREGHALEILFQVLNLTVEPRDLHANGKQVRSKCSQKAHTRER